jgi:L-lactate dehydrogenase complex protein LldG
MSARDDILGRLSRRQAEHPLRDTAAADRRLAERPRGPAVARAALPHDRQVDLFVQMALFAAASLERVPSIDAVPAALTEWLARENLPAELAMAPDPALDAIPWDSRPLLRIRRGIGRDGDPVAVARAFGGIAETGTLMLLSGPQSPTTLNFLPECEVVILHRRDVVGDLETAWARLRAARNDLPRTVNLVTGPSRSADIGQELLMGAHGPRRLHIILVDDGD